MRFVSSRLALATASALAVGLAGCAPSTGGGNAIADLNAAAERGQADVNAYAAANEAAPSSAPADEAPLAPADPGQPGGLPDDKTPVSEAPFAPDSAQGAANVVQTYYALIGERKFAQAWALWDDGGKASGQSAPAFAAELGGYREYHANVGAPGRIDAGAGQRYVTVPVQVYARRGDGTPAYWRGTATLHRTDVDGATAAQRRWHIRTIDLQPAPGKAAATTTVDPAPMVAARYRCMDGSKLAVRFDNRADTAMLVRDGKPLGTLAGRRPASGIWYARGGTELRGKGDAATLTTAGQPPIACTTIR